ncbi:MAG: Trm112 family protein [Sporichthyaceae bacterium]
MIDEALLAVLACPKCREPLGLAGAELLCTGASCALAYPVRDGIPVLLVDEARPTRTAG